MFRRDVFCPISGAQTLTLDDGKENNDPFTERLLSFEVSCFFFGGGGGAKICLGHCMNAVRSC